MLSEKTDPRAVQLPESSWSLSSKTLCFFFSSPRCYLRLFTPRSTVFLVFRILMIKFATSVHSPVRLSAWPRSLSCLTGCQKLPENNMATTVNLMHEHLTGKTLACRIFWYLKWSQNYNLITTLCEGTMYGRNTYLQYLLYSHALAQFKYFYYSKPRDAHWYLWEEKKDHMRGRKWGCNIVYYN